MSIAIVGMLDEREQALKIIKDQIEKRGHKVVLIDITIGTGAIAPALKADVSSDEIEVALSTQLFDDRLLIDGNFGVPTDKSSQQTSAIVGDVQVEYKLTQDGRFRVKAFNRSNDVSIIENDVPYTQGIGIFYRKDFNDLKELFTPAWNRKDKKAKKSGDEEKTGTE